LHDAFRRRPLALDRRGLVCSGRLQERKRGKYADTGKKQFSHDSPRDLGFPAITLTNHPSESNLSLTSRSPVMLVCGQLCHDGHTSLN